MGKRKKAIHALSGIDKAGIPAACQNCKRPVVITLGCIKIKNVVDIPGVYSHGFECPNCKYWWHSCFSNEDLDKLRLEVSKASGVLRFAKMQEYNKKFMAFQKSTIKTLADLQVLELQRKESITRQAQEKSTDADPIQS